MSALININVKILFALFVLLAFAPQAQAGDNGFSEEEKTIIHTIFDELVLDGYAHERRRYNGDEDDHKHKKEKKGGLPPGLAKRGGDLPPGLQKQIDETGHLPPGLEKRDLPPELFHRVHPGKGREIVRVDDDIYLIETATRAVIDVIRDVVK